MLGRLGLRLLRDLALLPVFAFLVYQLTAALPVPASDKKVIERLEQESTDVLAFARAWSKLATGRTIGDRVPRDAAELAEALGGSLRIGLLALLLALALGVAYALARSAAPHPLLDAALESVPIITYGTPTFVIATLVAVASIGRTEGAEFEPIAAAVVSIGPGIFLGTVLHGALRTEAAKPYMLTARAKGRGRGATLVLHALPNALPALLDALTPVATAVLAGSFVVETLFSLNYFGFVYVAAASANDRELVAVATTAFAALLTLVSMATEIARLALDPRARSRAREGLR